MCNVFDTAKYILETIGKDISTLKLQKLCYYSQAWHMVWNNKTALFENEIQAWANGPVVYDLFQEHKGKFSITSKTIGDNLLTNKLTELEKKTIDKVLDFYGNKDASLLSELSHKEKPWINARKINNTPNTKNCNEVITTDSMYNYYLSL